MLALVPIALLTALAAAVNQSRMAARDSQCHGEMFFLGHGLLGYRLRTGHFPPAVTSAPDGTSLHSWRAFAYGANSTDFARAYSFTQPWNSPGNLKAADLGARNLACPNTQGDGHRFTNYEAVLFPDGTSTLSRADSGIGMVPDHPERILFIEDPQSTVAWSEPRDLAFEALDSLGPGYDSRGLGVIFADGSFRRLPRDEVVAILRRQWAAYR
jgi:hypothetical protein